MDVFKEIAKLGLPKEDFMVLGSGILGALGIRPINDVDLFVKPTLFQELKEKGWKYEVIEIEGRPREHLQHGVVEAYRDFWWKEGTIELESALAEAEEIKGVRFLPLKTLLTVKKAMAREKDLKDVVLIEKYLGNNLS